MSVTQQNSQEEPIREEAMAQAQEAVMSQAKKRRAAIEKKLYLLHAATGHGSVRHLIDALKRRGDSEEVIQIAKEFKRSICHEKQRGKQLIKCCAEQLRRASERQALIEELSTDTQVPWTFTKVATETAGINSKMSPEKHPMTKNGLVHRILNWRTNPPYDNGFWGNDLEHNETRNPENQLHLLHNGHANRTTSRWLCLRRSGKNECLASHGARNPWSSGCSTTRPWPWNDTVRGRQQRCKNLEGFFVGALKRKAVEISERRLTPAEKEQFKEAKSVEVKSFIATEAFKCLPPHLQAPPEQVVGMRWILTWKVREDGTKKAKARAVLLGYQDPSHEHRAPTSPVMTRQSRQMILQYAAWKRWTIQKGDVYRCAIKEGMLWASGRAVGVAQIR
eukprot:s5801_g7.t1